MNLQELTTTEQYLTNQGIDDLRPIQLEILKKIINDGQNICLSAKPGMGKTTIIINISLHQLDMYLNDDNNDNINDYRVLILVSSRPLLDDIYTKFIDISPKMTRYVNNFTNFNEELKLINISTTGKFLNYQKRNKKNNYFKILMIDEVDQTISIKKEDEIHGDVFNIFNDKKFYNKQIFITGANLDLLPDYTSDNNCEQEEEIRNTLKKLIDAQDIEEINFKIEGFNYSEEIIKIERNNQYKYSQKDIYIDLISSIYENLRNELQHSDYKIIVFFNHKNLLEEIYETFKNDKCSIIHGSMDYIEIKRQLRLFKGTNNILLTTNICERGLDLPNIQSVIHIELPNSYKTYLNRNGRCTRKINSSKETNKCYIITSYPLPVGSKYNEIIKINNY